MQIRSRTLEITERTPCPDRKNLGQQHKIRERKKMWVLQHEWINQTGNRARRTSNTSYLSAYQWSTPKISSKWRKLSLSSLELSVKNLAIPQQCQLHRTNQKGPSKLTKTSQSFLGTWAKIGNVRRASTALLLPSRTESTILLTIREDIPNQNTRESTSPSERTPKNH